MDTEHVGKLSIVEGEEHDDLCTTLVLHGEDHTLGNFFRISLPHDIDFKPIPTYNY